MRYSAPTLFRQQDGSVAPIVGLCLFAIVLLLGGMLDLGIVWQTKRQLQTATDVAAEAAALNLSNAQRIATTAFGTNFPGHGKITGTILSVTTGTYDPAQASGARFVPGAANPSAVEVKTTASVPLMFFGLAVKGVTVATLHASAVAAASQQATFSAGTELLSINGGYLNSLLSSLLGTSISLSLLDYQNLAAANINLLDFLDSLATTLNLQVADYGTLLQQPVSAEAILAAAADAAGSDNQTQAGAQAALNSLAQQLGNPTQQLVLGNMLDLDSWAKVPLGNGANGAAAGQANVDALDLLHVLAQSAGANHLLGLNLNLSLPAGLASVTTKLAVGEGAQIATGPVGTTIHTAQTRLFLDVKAAGLIDLPLYVELAAGDAKLQAISCSLTSTSPNNAVTIAAAPSLANLYLGTFTTNQMTNFSTSLQGQVSPVHLVDLLGLVRIDAKAEADGSPSTTPPPMTFNQAQITAHTAQRASSGLALSGLVSSLLGNLQVKVTALGLLSLNLGDALAQVKAILTPILDLVTPVLQTVLQALGINLGSMDVAVIGVRCGVPQVVM